MRAHWVTALAAGALCVSQASRAATPGACEALAHEAWPNTEIDLVESVAAGTVPLFGAGNLPAGPAGENRPGFLPAHCLVRGVIGRRPSTVPGNTLGVGFELRMPDDWNGRFVFQGGGGGDGWLRQASGVIVSGTASRESALSRGFAVVSTDAGHESSTPSPPTDGRYGLDPQARADNARDAVPKTTDLAKQIIARYYGRPIEHAYFVGCSNGGRQGMLAAQTRPDDFDGIVAGDPAFDLNGAVLSWDWNARALEAIAPKGANGEPDLARALSDDDLALLSTATLQHCAPGKKLDESNPGQCQFDVATLQCRDDSQTGCLSAAKVHAIQAVQAGPTDSAGHALYSPWTQGGEAGPAGWRAWMLGTPQTPARGQAFVADWMRYIAVLPGQPPIDWRKFDFDHDPARIAGPDAPWLATGLDYDAFVRRGGRILWYQGSSDPAFPAFHLLSYYQALTVRYGGDRFSKLFLVPGMAHCSGGTAFDQFDPLQAIVDWVEKNQAPDHLTATGAAFPGQSRPLCPYPLVADRTSAAGKVDGCVPSQ